MRIASSFPSVGRWRAAALQRSEDERDDVFEHRAVRARLSHHGQTLGAARQEPGQRAQIPPWGELPRRAGTLQGPEEGGFELGQ
jgi:hypothetical protein